MDDDTLAQVIPFPNSHSEFQLKSISLMCGTCHTHVKWSSNCPPAQCSCKTLTVTDGRIIIGQKAGRLFAINLEGS